MTINDFNKELLYISEQYLKLEAAHENNRYTSTHRSHSDLLHIHLVNIWNQLDSASKNDLVNFYNQKISDAVIAKRAAIRDYIRKIENGLLTFYCSHDYRDNAYSIVAEMSEIYQRENHIPLKK